MMYCINIYTYVCIDMEREKHIRICACSHILWRRPAELVLLVPAIKTDPRTGRCILCVCVCVCVCVCLFLSSF